MGFPLYFDEDTSSTRLIDALRAREADVVSAGEAGLNAHSDEEQLVWAAGAGRGDLHFQREAFL